MMFSPMPLVLIGLSVGALSAVMMIDRKRHARIATDRVLLLADTTPLVRIAGVRPCADQLLTAQVTHWLSCGFALLLWVREPLGRNHCVVLYRSRIAPDHWRHLMVRLRYIWPYTAITVPQSESQ